MQNLEEKSQKTTISQTEEYIVISSSRQDKEWKYIDIKGNTQGPYTSKAMLSWFEKGFFKANLKVSYKEGEFEQLGVLYPNLNNSFKEPPIYVSLIKSFASQILP